MAIYFVDPLNGDDSRTAAQAQNPSPPWKTIDKATTSRTGGDEIRIKKSPDPEHVYWGSDPDSAYWSGTTVTFLDMDGSLVARLPAKAFIGHPDIGWWEIASASYNGSTHQTTVTLVRPYAGTVSAFFTYKLNPYDNAGTAPTANTTATQSINSGGSNTASRLKITGGWDFSHPDISTPGSTAARNGMTWYRNTGYGSGKDGMGYGLNSGYRTCIDIGYLGFLRYFSGITMQTPDVTFDHVECHGNAAYGLYMTIGGGNTFANCRFHGNGQRGCFLYFSGCADLTDCDIRSNAQYGLSNNGAIVTATRLYTAGNSLGGVYLLGVGYLRSCTMDDTTPIARGEVSSRTHSFEERGITSPANHRIVFWHGDISSVDGATYGRGEGLAWKMRPSTSSTFESRPLELEAAQIAVRANQLVTASVWVRKSATGAQGVKFTCPANQLLDGSAGASAYAANSTDWQKLTLSIPAQAKAGVLKLYVQTWGGTADVFVDSLEVR